MKTHTKQGTFYRPHEILGLNIHSQNFCHAEHCLVAYDDRLCDIQNSGEDAYGGPNLLFLFLLFLGALFFGTRGKYGY